MKIRYIINSSLALLGISFFDPLFAGAIVKGERIDISLIDGTNAEASKIIEIGPDYLVVINSQGVVTLKRNMIAADISKRITWPPAAPSQLKAESKNTEFINQDSDGYKAVNLPDDSKNKEVISLNQVAGKSAPAENVLYFKASNFNLEGPVLIDRISGDFVFTYKTPITEIQVKFRFVADYSKSPSISRGQKPFRRITIKGGGDSYDIADYDSEDVGFGTNVDLYNALDKFLALHRSGAIDLNVEARAKVQEFEDDFRKKYPEMLKLRGFYIICNKRFYVITKGGGATPVFQIDYISRDFNAAGDVIKYGGSSADIDPDAARVLQWVLRSNELMDFMVKAKEPSIIAEEERIKNAEKIQNAFGR
jgi:hypothetical protein